MREGELEVRRQSGLIEELGGLEVGQSAANHLFGSVGDGLEQAERDVLTDDNSRLKEPLLVRRKTVDPRREYRLHRGGHLNARKRLREAVAPRSPTSALVSTSVRTLSSR